MKKSSMITIIVILILIVFGVWIYSANKSNNSSNLNNTASNSLNNSNTNNSATPTGQTNQTGQLFSDSSFAQNSYLISTATYDANTKKALSGFSVAKKVLTDGSTQYTLNAQNPEYQTQTYIVKPGEKLYFIEQNLSDDNNGNDAFFGDDHAVLVDANGYIVQGP